MHHRTAVTALVLGLSLIGVRDLLAQRSGFIIGFGIGAGVTTWTEGFDDFPTSDSQTEVGVATDLKIGAQVSQSFQIYYVGRANWFVPEGQALHVAGISALGVTYVLPSAPVHLSAGVGLATWTEISLYGDEGFTGLGFTGGVGWEFARSWLFDIAVTYAMPGDQGRDLNIFRARAGISILSH